MLYPTLESSHYPELSKYRELFSGEDENTNGYDIRIIDHHKIKTSSEVFIEYTIFTQLDNQTFTVRRRYSDFDWLMKYLHQNYPFHILPPMPPKRVLPNMDKFSRPFIDKRQQSLNIMIRRLRSFQECMEDGKTQKFLKQNQQEFDQYILSHPTSSLFRRIRLSFKQLYSGSLISTKSQWKDDDAEYYIKMINERTTDRSLMISIINSMDLFCECWEDYSFSLLWFAQDMADLVLMMNRSPMTVYIDVGAQLFFNLATQGKAHCSRLCGSVQPLFIEYLDYNNQIIKTIKQRNQIKVAHHFKTLSFARLEAQHRSCDIQDMPKGSKYDELTKESIILEDNLKQFEEVFLPGLLAWKRQRSIDVAQCLGGIVSSNLIYHRSCLELCKHVLNKIQYDDIP